MAVAAVFTISISIFQWRKVKERYLVETRKDDDRPTFKQMIAATFTNKAAVIIYVYLFASALSSGVRSGFRFISTNTF